MRFTLTTLLVLLPGMAMATPQFSQSECQKLNAQRLEVRKQLRQPYNGEHGQQLQARLKELEQLLKQHCRQPVKDQPAVPVQSAVPVAVPAPVQSVQLAEPLPAPAQPPQGLR